jgi:hypothetical protein
MLVVTCMCAAVPDALPEDDVPAQREPQFLTPGQRISACIACEWAFHRLTAQPTE